MKLLKFVLLVAVLSLFPAMASAQFTPGAGLAGTPHDFTPANNPGTTEDVGLCTFCHTPHKALSTLLLWNHKLSTNATFSWDEAKTTGGTLFATFANTYKGPTAKCLSCHDGSVAIGDVNWWNEETPALPLNPDKHEPASEPHNVGFGGDMSGNHPVAMPYPYNGVGSTYNGSTTGPDVIIAEFKGTPADVRLFHDDGGSIIAGAVAGSTGIECSSCHDPHNKAATGDFFLRGSPTGSDASYICLKCHDK